MMKKLVLKIQHYQLNINEGNETHSGNTNRRCPNISKIKSIGYYPKINIDKGLDLTINWYINNIKTTKNDLL